MQHYFTVNFSHENQKALELRTEDAKDCDEWVAAIAHARYVPPPTVAAEEAEPEGPARSRPRPGGGGGRGRAVRGVLAGDPRSPGALGLCLPWCRWEPET